jgi:hypothetical protein
MSKFFAIVFMFSAAALVVGLVRPSFVRQPTRKRVALVFASAAVASFLLVGITMSPPVQSPAAVSAVKSSQAQARPPAPETRPKTLDEMTVGAAQRALANRKTGFKATYKEERVDDEDGDPTRAASCKLASVSYYVPEFFDKDDLIENTGALSASAFRNVFALSPAICDVVVMYYSDLINRYGHRSQGEALSYNINRKTFNKIDWTGFNEEKLCGFLQEEDKLTGGDMNTQCIPQVKIE